MVRPRLTIRGLVLLVAAIGLLTLGYRLVGLAIWRRGVGNAIAGTVANGPEPDWGVSWIGGGPTPPREDEYTFLRTDPKRSIDSFLATVRNDPDPTRRINAVRGIRSLFRQPIPPEIPPWFANHASDVVMRGTLPPAVEAELVYSIADCVWATGLDEARRAAFLALVQSDRARRTPAWIGLLDEIAGRREVEFLVKLGSENDPKTLAAVHSALKVSLWPGLFPSLERWLADPTLAPHAIEYSLLTMRPRGRAMLLAYARGPEHPAELRRRAVERLLENAAGVDLILPHRAELAWLDGLDAKIDAALAGQQQREGDAIWLELIEGIPTEEPTAAKPADPEARKRPEVRQAVGEASARCLQLLSGETSRRTKDDWQRWYRFARPRRVTLGEIARLLLRHPEASGAAVLRRLHPNHLGTIPEADLPDLLRLAHQGRVDLRFWACRAILLFTESTEVVPDVIEILGRREPLSASPVVVLPSRFAEASLLRTRFAENHFLDATAWRAWWAKEQTSKE